MPSKSPSQHRLMEAAAHTKGGFGGVPQSVGKDFATADKGNKMFTKGMKPQTASYAAGGPVLGKYSNFMKAENEFTDPGEGDASADEDQKYGKSGEGAGTGFVKPPKNTKKVIK